MIPERAAPPDRLALLASGAGFSREVLRALCDIGYPPQLIVLPEFPPAQPGAHAPIELSGPQKQPAFVSLAPGIDIAYAPPTAQAQCAGLLRDLAIDFALIACWPYLIDPVLIRAPRKAMLNLHPSLLPAYRGADPVGAQIDARERRGGVTLHLLDARFDHGDIVAQAAFDLHDDSRNRRWIEVVCATIGAGLLVDAVFSHSGGWQTRSQPD